MTAVTDQELAWFHSWFLAQSIRKTGFEWQALVTNLMYAKYGGLFLQVDPSGRGDKGCDGWVDGLMLACYGASSPNEKYVIGKIKTDFAAASAHWQSAMTRWAFVHNNANGLPAMAVKGITDLQKQLKIDGHSVTVEAWPPQVLWDHCCPGLSREQLVILFGAPPSEHPAGMNYIARCVESLARTRLADCADEVAEVPFGKIEHNRFNGETAELIKRFQVQTGHVRYYFSQATPGEQAQASENLRARYDKYRAVLQDSSAVFHALCDDLLKEAFPPDSFRNLEERRSAAIMVVTHFFEICDIFETPEVSFDATAN